MVSKEGLRYIERHFVLYKSLLEDDERVIQASLRFFAGELDEETVRELYVRWQRQRVRRATLLGVLCIAVVTLILHYFIAR